MTKHFATKFYFTQQVFEEELILIDYIPSRWNLADAMTKAVGKNILFTFLMSNFKEWGSVGIMEKLRVLKMRNGTSNVTQSIKDEEEKEMSQDKLEGQKPNYSNGYSNHGR